MSKFEKLLDLLVNENKDEAEKLFHEIVVEKSREIYEGILAEDEKAEDEEVTETEESSDKADDDEVAETKEESDEAVEETEEPAEATEETVEEIGGDATDDLLSDIEAEAEGMDDMDVPDEEGEEEGGEAEEVFEPLEKELEALKAEFAKMMDDKGEEAEETVEPEFEAAEETEETVESEEAEEVEESTEKKDADTLIKEYSEAVKADMGDHADEKHSPVSKSNKPSNAGKPHAMGVGGEEKGSKAESAKDMGVKAKNEPGIKSAKLETAPKAETSEKAADKTSPVAKK